MRRSTIPSARASAGEGMCQHDIAATFHVNPGRINEVLKGRRFPEAERIAREGR